MADDTIPAWTYSRIEAYETCPKQFYHTKVKRDVVEPETMAQLWGKRVHTAFEVAIAEAAPLPEGMTQWQPLVDKFIALPGKKLVEFQFSLDSNFQPSPWKGAWTRGIADLVLVHNDRAVIVDWKTGKRKPSEQLDLYAGYAKAYWPHVTHVQTAYVWLQEKKITKKTLVVDEAAPAVWQAFLPRVRKLERAYENDLWPAKPSGLCRGWCHVKTCTHFKERTQ